MWSFLKLVIPGLQSQPDIDVGALRQEVVKELLEESEDAQADGSHPADESVTDTSSEGTEGS